MKYDPKTYERSLTRFIARQALLVQKLIDEAVSQSVLETERFGVKKGEGEDFFFKDYPGLSRKIDGILHSLTGRMDKVVQSGIKWGWELANSKNDDMVWKVINSIGSTRVPYEAPERWMQKNLPALKAFENRRISGMNLSDRVWNYTAGIKGDLELALDLGLGEGASADRLSREVRGYLREPDRLYRRVRDEKGVLRLSKSASNYHPGQGVYRSSYKNAKRLTATETNMAYRSADYERNQQLDFVLGIEVHLSSNHTCLNEKGEPEPFHDICDELEGRYPADFKFTGWHPQCRCYATTILPSQEEMASYLASMDENGHSDYQFSGRVTDMPPQFKEWVAENAERIEAAEGRGKLPYFLRDNRESWEGLLATPQMSPEERFEEIKEGWRIIGASDYKEFANCEASKFDFVGFKKEVEDIFGTKSGGQIKIYNDDEWSFMIKGRGFQLNRYFYKEPDGLSVCEHEYFELDDALQGKGLSKKLFNALYEQYKAVGVQKLTVHANLNVGGYTWARYGFCADSRSVAEKAIAYHATKYPEKFEAASKIIDDYYTNNNLSNRKPFPMNLLGKKYKNLLIGGDWNGFLDFRDKKQLAVWEEYLKG